MIRNLELNDLVILEKNNTIPDLFNGPYKLIHSIDYNKELVGAFWARVTVEPTLIFKESISKLSRARALEETFKFLNCQIPEQLNINDCYITLNDKEFNIDYIKFLKKHYNCEEVKQTLRIRR